MPPPRIRIGCVSYLNSLPYVMGLGKGRLHLAPPSELARMLEEGSLDVALVPLAFCLLNPRFRVVEGFSISCLGRVESVLMERMVELDFIRAVQLDPSSMTSNLLCQVLCRKYWGINPSFTSHEEAQARVVIGDRALRRQEKSGAGSLEDMGSAWYRWCGLPFVFAVWAIHPDFEFGRKPLETFRKRCREGIARRESLVTQESEQHYLTHSVRYGLGEQEREGIEVFRRALMEMELLPAASPPLAWL